MSKGALLIAAGKPKGGSYGDDEGDDADKSEGSDDYSDVGKELIDAVESGDAAAVGEALRKAAMRCMADS